MNEMTNPVLSPVLAPVNDEEHWATRDGGVNLFMWNKNAGTPAKNTAPPPRAGRSVVRPPRGPRRGSAAFAGGASGVGREGRGVGMNRSGMRPSG